MRRDFEREAALEQDEVDPRTGRAARTREARFAKALERHLEDRRRFHELRGVPATVKY